MPAHTSEGHTELFHHPVAKAISTLADQEERENKEEFKGLVLNQAKAAL